MVGGFGVADSRYPVIPSKSQFVFGLTLSNSQFVFGLSFFFWGEAAYLTLLYILVHLSFLMGVFFNAKVFFPSFRMLW